MKPDIKTDTVNDSTDKTIADQKSADMGTHVSEPINSNKSYEKAAPKANSKKHKRSKSMSSTETGNTSSSDGFKKVQHSIDSLIQEINAGSTTPLGASGFSPVEGGNYRYQFNEAVYNKTGSSYNNLVGLMNFDELSKLSKVTNILKFNFPDTKLLMNPVEIVNTTLLREQYNDPTIYQNELSIPVYFSIGNYASYLNIEGHMPTTKLRTVINVNDIDLTLTKASETISLAHWKGSKSPLNKTVKPTAEDIGWRTPNGDPFSSTTQQSTTVTGGTGKYNKEATLSFGTSGAPFINNGSISPSLDMSINQNNYLVSISRVYNNITKYVSENYETKAHPFWADIDFVYTHVKHWTTFGTFLHIIIDSLKGNLDAVKPISTKIGIIDDTIKYFLNDSVIRRKRLSARLEELASLAEKLPVNFEVLDAWERAKRFSLFGKDLLDEDSLLLNKFFIFLVHKDQVAMINQMRMNTSAAVPSLIVPLFDPLTLFMQNLNNQASAAINGYGNNQSTFAFSKTGNGITAVDENSLRYTRSYGGNDMDGYNYASVSYNRMTPLTFSICYDLLENDNITAIIRDWTLKFNAFFQFFKDSNAFNDTIFGYKQLPIPDFTKYEDYKFGSSTQHLEDIRPLFFTKDGTQQNLTLPIIKSNDFNGNYTVHTMILDPYSDVMQYDTRFKGAIVSEATDKPLTLNQGGDMYTSHTLVSLNFTDTINIPLSPARAVINGVNSMIAMRANSIKFTGGNNQEVFSPAFNFEWGKLTSNQRKLVNTKKDQRHSSNVVGGYYVTSSFWGAASKSNGRKNNVYANKLLEYFGNPTIVPYAFTAYVDQRDDNYVDLTSPFGMWADTLRYVQDYNAYWVTEPFAELNPQSIGTASGKFLTVKDVQLKW